MPINWGILPTAPNPRGSRTRNIHDKGAHPDPSGGGATGAHRPGGAWLDRTGPIRESDAVTRPRILLVGSHVEQLRLVHRWLIELGCEAVTARPDAVITTDPEAKLPPSIPVLVAAPGTDRGIVAAFVRAVRRPEGSEVGRFDESGPTPARFRASC